MKPAAALQDTIEVDRLRVGMLIELDGGWMSHPFPLSRFRIASAEQIATIRGLGLRRVRWNPGQSERRRAAGAADAEPAAEAAVVVEDATAPLPQRGAPLAPTRTDDAAPRRAACAKLAAQRAALDLCRRRFDEAAQDLSRLTDSVLQQPVPARWQAEALSRALTDKVLGEQQLCIRLLTGVAGDQATRHALNVTVLSMLLGRALGLSEPEMQDLGAGAMLHDIGKLELPAHARNRDPQAPLAMARLYEDHVPIGLALAERMGLSPGATLVIGQHHEHADGSGFPLRLNADRTTLASRIVGLVNRYDNLCNPHLPGTALTPHESLSLLFAQGQPRFETGLLGAFIRMLGVYPAGSTVQLTDDRYAVVVGVNSSRPLKPQVRVHEPGVPADEALFVSLDRVPHLGIRRCIRPRQLPDAARHDLAPGTEFAYFFEPLAQVPHDE